MLANGIKNAILFLLIILILHFLIKNVTGPTAGPVAKKIEGFLDNLMNKTNYAEVNTADKSDGMVTVNNCKINLPVKSDNQHLPLSTTCDANIMELRPEDNTKKVKEDCRIYQDHKNFTMIKTYENENPNNGGKLYDDVSVGAFDSFEEYYHKYASSCGDSHDDVSKAS